MKKRLNKIVSLICTLALIVSMCSFVTAFASGDVDIITAQFLPYEGQMRVLASISDGYTDAKVYVNGTEIATTSATQADGDVVFTSTSFTPAYYGVATVKLEANVGGVTSSDTQNVKIYEVTSKKVALTENFDQLEAIKMENTADSSVTNLLANSSSVLLDNVGNGKNNSIASIANNYGGMLGDNKSFVVEIPNTLVNGIPTIKVDPDNITSGVAELCFDMYASKASPRLSLRFETTTGGTYAYNSLKYPRNVNNNGVSLHNGSYWIKSHDYDTCAFSDKKYEIGKWNNIRFLIDFDKSTYEYYVNHELIDYGTIATSKGAGYKHVLMQIGCSGENVELAFDNIVVNHLSVVSIPVAKEQNIVSTLNFENGYNSEFTTVTQTNAAIAGSAVTSAGTYGEQNGAFVYYTANGKSGKAAIIQKDLGTISGRIVLEHDLYLEDAKAEIQWAFKGGKTSYYPYDIMRNKGNIVRKQIYNGKVGNVSKTFTGWHKVKFVIDTVTGTSEMFFDNEFLGKTNDWTSNYTSGSTNTNAPTQLENVSITYFAGTTTASGNTALAIGVDNFRIYKELPIAEATSVTKYDISGNSAAVVRTDVISADSTDKFEIALTNTEYLNQASLEANAKVLADGVEVQDAVSLSDGTLTIDVSDVPAHADLELVIGKDTLLYDGTTTIGADTVFNLKSANENGLYIKRAVDTNGEALSADCDLDVVSGSKNVVAIFASYDGDELVGITSKAATLTGAKSLSMTLPKASATKVKVFVWDDIASNATPYETQISYSIPSQN